MIELKVQNIIAPIAVVVIAVWAIVVFTSVITKDYAALTIITPVVLIVAGALFGIRSGGRDKTEDV